MSPSDSPILMEVFVDDELESQAYHTLIDENKKSFLEGTRKIKSETKSFIKKTLLGK